MIDYVPARVTSLGFAVVGSFEEAIDAWRQYAHRFAPNASAISGNRNDGVILAATSGAVNVQLGGAALKARLSAGVVGDILTGLDTGAASDTETVTKTEAFESTPGRQPEVAHLRSIVGLVWRSVVLWMVLLALLTLARLLG